MTDQARPPRSRPADADAADDELLIDGQEEVFAREEVLRGRIEHHFGEEDGSKPDAASPFGRPGDPPVGNRG